MNYFTKATKAFMRGFNKPDEPRTEEEIEYDISKAKQDIEDESVDHLLHLILSIITMGLWTPIWIIIALNSSGEKAVSKSKLKELSKEETLNNYTTNISLSQELTNLSKLHENGILSEEEYKIAKMKVLSSMPFI